MRNFFAPAALLSLRSLADLSLVLAALAEKVADGRRMPAVASIPKSLIALAALTGIPSRRRVRTIETNAALSEHTAADFGEIISSADVSLVYRLRTRCALSFMTAAIGRRSEFQGRPKV